MAARSITWRTASTAAVMAAVTVGSGPAASAAPPKPTDLAHFDGSTITSLWGDDDTKEGKKATRATGTWDAASDHGSLFSITAGLGAQAAWSRGVTGKDVTVAVIDTGIAPVPGLDKDDKVLDGPDLSFEGQSAATAYIDGFGHGTHMAGIIAGEDRDFDPKKPSPAQFAGVAPDAQLLNMKVAAADGGADVSQVIAALDWVVQHRRDQGMHVRVVNLAYGTASVQPWQVDPLAHAVENAWDNGIVVVAAAGNDGLAAGRLLMPATDPHVIAVGAVDHMGSDTPLDDRVADFTSGGSAERRPDVLAPGKSVVSLRVPGSYADDEHPEGLVAGDASGSLFRGSGTSQATAVVSGEVALLLQARPSLTPDQVKALLMATARPLARHPQPAMGAGVTDVEAALRPLVLKLALPRLGSTDARSTGTGSIEESRGGEHVVDPTTGVELSGEVDAVGAPWRAAAWAQASADGVAWAKGSWNGRVWTGEKWKDKQVLSAPWSGDSWSGVAWGRHEWSDASWTGRSWRASQWSGRSWRASSWSGRSWRSVS